MFSMFYTDDKKVIQEIDFLLDDFIKRKFGEEYSVRSFDSIPFVPFIGTNEKGSSRISAEFLLKYSDVIEVDPYARIWFRPSDAESYFIGISTVLKKRSDLYKLRKEKGRIFSWIINLIILYLGYGLIGAYFFAPGSINEVLDMAYSVVALPLSILTIYFWIKSKGEKDETNY